MEGEKRRGEGGEKRRGEGGRVKGVKTGGGSGNGLGRRRRRGGGGSPTSGRKAKEGVCRKKLATAYVSFQRESVVSVVGFAVQLNICSAVCASNPQSGQMSSADFPIRCWKDFSLEQNPERNCERVDRTRRGNVISFLSIGGGAALRTRLDPKRSTASATMSVCSASLTFG